MIFTTRKTIGLFLTIALSTSLVACGGGDSSASGSSASGASAPATDTATAVATGPSISGTPATQVTAGSAYSFTPTASDDTDSAWTFTITNRPSWAQFDSATGTLSGTPTAASVGTYSQIVIGVTDGTKVASLASFTITVAAPAATASDVSIAGTPATTVAVGAKYSFKPTATDGSGDTLKFTISNKPVWATFDSTTGALTGTPVVSNVGVSAQVEISATDGTHTASLAAFSVTVTSAPMDSVTLSWTAPTVNTTGEPLSNLAGYHVYYGTSEKNMTSVITVPSATDLDQVVSNLTPGTWYFAVTSYNSDKVESKMSAIIPVTI